MEEQEFLERERKIELAFREGFITLEEKRTALANLMAEWEKPAPIDYGDCPPETWNANWPPFQG
jgi:hypothetical protein